MAFPTTPAGDQRALRDGGPASACVAMTSGTTYTQGRAFLINCTVAGTVTLTFPDASTMTLNLAAAGQYEWNYAIIKVTTGNATATYYNLY